MPKGIKFRENKLQFSRRTVTELLKFSVSHSFGVLTGRGNGCSTTVISDHFTFSLICIFIKCDQEYVQEFRDQLLQMFFFSPGVIMRWV